MHNGRPTMSVPSFAAFTYNVLKDLAYLLGYVEPIQICYV